MLVKALGPQIELPAQPRIAPVQQRLKLQRIRQILLPVRVLQPALVCPDDQHHLRAACAVHLRRKAHLIAVSVRRRITMDIQHHLNGRILLQIPLDRRLHPRICAVIGRIVVERRVMQCLDPMLVQHRRDLVPDANDGPLCLLRAQRVRLLILPPRFLRIRLRGVRVDNEDLRSLAGKIQRGRARQQRSLVHRIRAAARDRDSIRLFCRKFQASSRFLRI